ncbi:MAG: HAMP domain-containing histidine kinase [Deltaproteobacteria bacterium]|nr:HAMP domain-containing histidine kinase [Deltaproteobacteria bacterium]MBI3389976.1 HAMP domain-containing histidine kinase [Deltaproteobacteria bacterium]
MRNQPTAEPEVTQDLLREAYENTRTLTLWGAGAYILFLPTPFLRFPLRTAVLLAVLQLSEIACLLLIRFAQSQGKIPLHRANEALAATLAVPMVDLLIRSYVAYTPDRAYLVALYLIAVGVFCLSRMWVAVLLGTTVATWLPLVWLRPESRSIVETILPLAAGSVVGLLARNVRMGAVRRVERLRQRDVRHLHEARVNEAKFREEAGVSAALARVGAELIAALDEPALLDRLCRLTTEVLACDLSHTYLRIGSEDVFMPVSVYGHTREHEEMIRALRLAPDLNPGLASFLERLERQEVVTTDLSTQPGALAEHGRRHNIVHLLHVALRRGGRVIGFHAAGYYGNHEPFTAVQIRIATGLAHLASLALENARLLSELGRASQLKSDFMATMSHELRTPLNVIIGFSDLLRGGTFGALSRDQLGVLESIDKSTRDLLELIVATLDLSRLERGEVPLDIGAVDLGELVNEVHDENVTLWQRAGRDFAVHVPPTLPVVRTDRMKLKVVLKNLIGNAAKFTPGGRIEVDVQARADGVEIRVVDTGIGIAPEVMPTIFEPFRQGDASGVRAQDGVGLGLYIVRRLLDMMGGTVDVESTVGVGSTFRVRVPFSVTGGLKAKS